VDQELIIKDTHPLDSAESSKILADYLTRILREIFNYIDEGDTIVSDRVNLCNGILQYITECIQKGSFSFKKDEETLKRVKSFLIQQDAQMLLSLVDKKASRQTALLGSKKVVRPDTSISGNSLFTGAVHEPSMVSELKKEILSSHRIDFLVSFIKWSGLRLIINELTQFTANGGKLRVITTSYLGATDFKAAEQLSKLSNTEIHIYIKPEFGLLPRDTQRSELWLDDGRWL
jgi:hypothetical protein